MNLSEVEAKFDEVSDTQTDDERAHLDGLRDTDTASYGHDLWGAIKRGQMRKEHEALTEAARWTQKILGGRADPNQLVYHLIHHVIRWGLERGATREGVIRHLGIIKESVSHDLERQNRA